MSDLDPSAPRDPIVLGNASADDARRLLRWQRVTVATLCFGYGGVYFCRSNLSVVAKRLSDEELSNVGGMEAMGAIFSAGVVCYALGKLLNGVLCDFVGGRRMFLFAMAGAAVATVVFGLASGFWAFLVIWCVNRVIQSGGWPALVKISSAWFPVAGHGRVMGVLSLSYLIGDAAAKFSLGQLMTWGMSWRGLFFCAAAFLAGLAVICAFTLRSSPRSADIAEPPANPGNVFGPRGEDARPDSLRGLLLPLLSESSFWLICFMSFGLTLIRETFNSWTPTYLEEVAQFAPDAAAKWAALFPLFGALSVLVAGWLVDRVTPGKRGAVMVSFLAVAVVSLFALSGLREPGHATMQLVLICAVAFFMIGPYGFLAAVISLDLGGKRGSATASGLVDAAGYASGIVSGYGVAVLAQRWGWGTAFLGLALIATATLVAAGLYWWTHEIRPPRRRDPKGFEVVDIDAS